MANQIHFLDADWQEIDETHPDWKYIKSDHKLSEWRCFTNRTVDQEFAWRATITAQYDCLTSKSFHFDNTVTDEIVFTYCFIYKKHFREIFNIFKILILNKNPLLKL